MTIQFSSVLAGVRYLEVPKAACCSIKAALLKAEGIDCKQWMHNHKHWEGISDEFVPDTVFTFVRHPFSRLESAYREKLRTGKFKIIDPLCPLSTASSFPEWVDWVTSQDPIKCNKHWKPQVLVLERQRVKPHFIGRFESLETDWEKLRESHPLLPKLSHINPSPDYDRVYWDGFSVEKTAKFYERDLQQWEYSVEGYQRKPGLHDWETVQGYMDKEEGEELQKLARGKRVLEIGVWKARSTVAMAATANHIVAIDHFKGDGFAGRHNTSHGALTSLCDSGARDWVTLIVGPWPMVIHDLGLDLSQFGFIHYDAHHTYEATIESLELLVKVGVPLAVHDYDNNINHAGVRKAVDEVLAKTGRTLRTIRRLAVLEVPSHEDSQVQLQSSSQPVSV